MNFKQQFNDFADRCHLASYQAGWWHETDGTPLLGNKYVSATKLFLIVSEIVEGLEGHRSDKMDDKLPHRPMVEVELADAIIRIGDYATAHGLDVGGAIEEKMSFNVTRPDHQVVNRRAPGGKKY